MRSVITKSRTWFGLAVFVLVSGIAYQNCSVPVAVDQGSTDPGNSGSGVDWGGNDGSFNQPSSENGGVPTVPALVEAEKMETKTTGQQENTVWNIWSEGAIENKINFPASAEYEFGVVGYGSQAANAWPEMEIRVDGQAIGLKTVSTGTMTTTVVRGAVSAGVHTVSIAFLNDLMAGSEDRNLYVDKLKIVVAGAAAPTPTPTPSTGGTGATPVPQGPTPVPVNGVTYPFGSHKFTYSGNSIKPALSQSAMDDQVRKLYDHWKASYLKQGCGGYYIAGGQQGYLAVSEGQGYGMLVLVLMAGYDPDARTAFDGIHRFARARGSTPSPYLMSWLINNDCSIAGPWPAADGDLDMAMALLMADKQWGSNGAINYLQEAKTTINAIRTKLMQSYNLIGSGPLDLVRTSDMMIGHFRAFQKATGDSIWATVIDNSFNILDKIVANYAPNTGLHPDFIQNSGTNNPSPSPGGRLESNLEGYYSYNACRNPWRLATDYIVSADARSKLHTQRIIEFFKKSSGGDPSRIYAVYKLDGTVVQQYNNLSFQAPIMLGAIVDASNQQFLNSMWNYVSPKTATYYDESIELISMIVVSGNWWQP